MSSHKTIIADEWKFYDNDTNFFKTLQSKSFKSVASKSLNSSFKNSTSNNNINKTKPIGIVKGKLEDSGGGDGDGEKNSELLADAICDIFAQAIKIPIIASAPEQVRIDQVLMVAN